MPEGERGTGPDGVGFTVDWSNPLVGALDATIRGAIKELGLDDYLEKVSGDNERLRAVAQDWRSAAREMQGVVDDLRAERHALGAAWTGTAATAFGGVIEHHTGADVGETVAPWGDKAESALHDLTGIEEVRVGEHTWDVEHQEAPLPSPPPKEQADYLGRPDPQSFDDRLTGTVDSRTGTVREVFG